MVFERPIEFGDMGAELREVLGRHDIALRDVLQPLERGCLRRTGRPARVQSALRLDSLIAPTGGQVDADLRRVVEQPRLLLPEGDLAA